MNTELDKFTNDDEELAKQRRNVMVTASIVTLIYLVGIKVTTINLGVTGLSFENSKMLFSLLQIALLYFLVRYVVLFLKVKSIDNPKIYNAVYESILNQILITHDELITHNNFNTKIKKELAIYLRYDNLRKNDFTSSFSEEGKIKPADISVDKELVNLALNHAIKYEFWNGVGIIKYIFPIIFGLLTLLFTSFYTLNVESKPITSFKNMDTRFQIKEYCEEQTSFNSLEYKLCIKELEKKLY